MLLWSTSNASMSEPLHNLGMDVRLAIFEQQLNTINEKQTTIIELQRQILAMRVDMAVQESNHKKLDERVNRMEEAATILGGTVSDIGKQQVSLKSWIAGAAFVGVFVSVLLNWIVKTQMEPLIALPQKVMQIEYSIQKMAEHERKENATKR